MTSGGDPVAGTADATEGEWRCAACAAGEVAAASLLSQASSGPDAASIDWSAVCNGHAWQLAEGPTPAADVAAAILRRALEGLAGSAGAPAWPGRRREPPSPPAHDDICPCCAALAAGAGAVVQRAAGGEAGVVLCLPHLCDALALVRGRERVRQVAQAALGRFAALEEELSEVIRKSDYRFRDEPRGPEATSWARAGLLAAGVPGVRWTLRRYRAIEG